jgi:hypothetical protein
MASLLQVAACIGLSGEFSIVRDFFGYASGPPWSLAPSQDNLPQNLSLLKQMKLVRQPHFNLHLIRVGTTDRGLFPQAISEQQVDASVALARRVYSEIEVGIGKVNRWWFVPISDGTGYDDCEADELIDAYDLPADGIKVFFVTAWPCSSSSSCTVGRTDGDDDGSVVLLQTSWVATGRSLAHELGHVFGFGHENGDPNNLMCQGGTAKKALGITSDEMIPATTGFYDWQAGALRKVADMLAQESFPPGFPVNPTLDLMNPALRWIRVRC